MATPLRRIHDAHFKTKVVLEALKGVKTLAQLSSEFGIHAQMITDWKRQALDGIPSLFETTTGKAALPPEQREQMFNEIKAIIDKAKANPNDVEAQLEAADQFIQVSQPDEALEFLEQAQKANPNDARAFHGFGIVYTMKGQFAEAITAGKRSLELNPGNPRVQMLLAGAYIQSKTSLDEADRLLREIEASGAIPQQVIASAREDLNNARSGAKDNAGARAKTMLNHGPEEPKNPK